MPAINGAITSYGIAENATDVSPAFYNINNPLTVLLNKIALGKGATDTEVKWFDDVRLPNATTLAANYVAASGTATFTSAANIRTGSIIRIVSTILRVVSIVPATGVAAVVAVAGDANRASGLTALIVGNAQLENKAFGATDTASRVERSNYTQIFDEGVEVSGTQEVIKRYVGAGDIVAEEVARKLRYLNLQLGRAAWDGPKVAATDNTTPRLMGGVRHFIDTYGYCPSTATFTQDNIDAFLLELSNNGANLVEIWCNPLVAKKFSALMANKLMVARDDGKTGNFVKTYVSSIGVELSVYADPACSDTGAFYVFESSLLTLRPLRSMQVQPIAKAGDGSRSLLVGEYSLQFNNSATAGKFTITP